MNKPAIIFFDIDGTLLDFGKKDLSPKTREALLKLRENGIRICIATGRAPLAVPKFAGVEFDAYLTYNGCYCYEGSKTIYSNPMPQVDVQTPLSATRLSWGGPCRWLRRTGSSPMERIRIWNNTMRSEIRKTQIAQSGMWIPSALFVLWNFHPPYNSVTILSIP